MTAIVVALALLIASPAVAQDGQATRVMAAVRTALAPALPFPETDEDGAMPANNSTEALWMVRYPQPGEQTVEVIANPLNQVVQLRATRAMAQIEVSIEAAQRRAALQYENAVAEAKRTGRSQEVDGVTLSDEGVAGAKIDAESRVLIEVSFGLPAYTFSIGTSVEPAPARQMSVAGSVAVITTPSNVYRDDRGVEHYAEADTQVFLGRVAVPEVRKRGDRLYDVTAAATAADNVLPASIVVRLRGNEILIAEIVRQADWKPLLELLK